MARIHLQLNPSIMSMFTGQVLSSLSFIYLVLVLFLFFAFYRFTRAFGCGKERRGVKRRMENRQ